MAYNGLCGGSEILRFMMPLSFFRVAYCVSLSCHRSRVEYPMCRSIGIFAYAKIGGQSVIVPMMLMTVTATIIRLPIIATFVIGLRPRGVAIAWRMTIIGAVAVAVGATAED